MKNLTSVEIPEEMHRVKILAAIGLYKTESEWVKKGIRQLQLGHVKEAKGIRKILDKALEKEELSAIIRRMRERNSIDKNKPTTTGIGKMSLVKE